MQEARLIDIETKLAHQEKLLIELNEVVADQQGQLIRLDDLCTLLAERVRSLGDDSFGGSPGDERPPLY